MIQPTGHEYKVLQGAKHSLQSGIITTIYCENAPNLIEASGIDIHEYYHFMISLGFLPYNDIDDLLLVCIIPTPNPTLSSYSLILHPNPTSPNQPDKRTP